MPLSALKAIDDVDTRREILYLMQKLSPGERVAFLHWCASEVNETIKLRHNPPWVLVVVHNETGSADESYLDFAGMVAQWGLDLGRALGELERRVARK